MRNTFGFMASVAMILFVTGCGKPTTTETTTSGGQTADQATTVADAPAEATHVFLEALRTGNDEKATQMLSKMAREKAASLNKNVTPPASDTASFVVGKVDYVAEDGARVACKWTDVDPDGKSRTDEAIWVLRREAEGWRIAGVAAQVFADQPPLLLNFEDPEDMARKQQWVREEYRRRAEADGLQAQTGEKQETPLRR
jgi:hypothetical protein